MLSDKLVSILVALEDKVLVDQENVGGTITPPSKEDSEIF